jgi:hypothetical protein
MSNSHVEVNRDRCLSAAIKLLKIGYWPVAIHPGQKRPIGNNWGVDRWDEERLTRTFAEHLGAGVGICLGPLRGPGGTWLVDIESDGPEAPDSFAALMGKVEPDCVAWSSARGAHNLFEADGERLLRLLAAAGAKEGSGIRAGVWKLPELAGLEIRVGGFKPDGSIKQCQSVCPPTVGDDGRPRAWLRAPKGGGR